MLKSDSSETWRAESEAIHKEMERLILSTWPRSAEENQIRKIQFAALIERRNDAARRFLQEATIRRRVSSAGQSDGPEKSVPR